MASHEMYQARLSEAERDALIAKLDEAGAFLGAGRPPKMVFSNGDGTWDVGCTLEGKPVALQEALSAIYLDIDMP